jgi:hypothetical protein
MQTRTNAKVERLDNKESGQKLPLETVKWLIDDWYCVANVMGLRQISLVALKTVGTNTRARKD